MKSLLLLLAATILSYAAREMTTYTRVLMGTYVSVTLPRSQSPLTYAIFERLSHIEHALSTFDPNASLAKINHDHTIAYDPMLAKALKTSIRLYTQTDGYFDVTIGSITKTLYRFGETDPGSPTYTQLQHARRDIKGVHITNKTITNDP